MKKINAQGLQIYTFTQNKSDYISLTDMARHKNPLEPKDVVKNWMRNYSMIEFLGIWERINNANFKGVEFDSFWKKLYNPNFKPVEFDGFKKLNVMEFHNVGNTVSFNQQYR